MGEQAKHEQAPAPAEVTKPEEKPEEAAKPPEEEAKKAEAEAPKPPPPCVLYVDLHCVGCAKKIERSIMRLGGVEAVEIDMAQNQVTVKGIVEPQAVCNRIVKKTRRMTKVLSPLPATEGEPAAPQVVAAQVSAPITVELNVNMHCEACAEQLKKKILKMKGVQTAQTEFNTGKVMVTGTMDANKLVDYVYRRTKKKAQIVPQPEPELPPPAEEEKKEEEQKPAAEGDPKPPPQENDKPPEPTQGEKPPEDAKGEGDKPPEGTAGASPETQELTPPPPIYHLGGGGPGGGGQVMINHYDHYDESMRRMMYYRQYPMYMIERIPPPQLFSDENPNACCIS